MREIVNGLLLRDNQVLLVRRSRQRSAYPGLWSFAGGHVEGDETLSGALVRELGEELGIVPLEFRLLSVLVDTTVPTLVMYHMFAVTHWQGEPALRGDEHSEMTWVSIEAASLVRDLALDSYRPLLQRCRTLK